MISHPKPIQNDPLSPSFNPSVSHCSQRFSPSTFVHHLDKTNKQRTNPSNRTKLFRIGQSRFNRFRS